MKCPKCRCMNNPYTVKRCGHCNEILPEFTIPRDEQISEFVLTKPAHLLKAIEKDSRLLTKARDLSRSAKDISGQRLHQHLKNMGIDAEIIPRGTRGDPGIESCWFSVKPKYYYSIRVKGLNFDVIQIKRYDEFGPEHTRGYMGYRIEYIVRGFERQKWHLSKRLKRLGSSRMASLISVKTFGAKKVVKVSPDKENQCVRIYAYIPFLNTLLNTDKVIIEEHGRRVKYRFVKDSELPSSETIAAYDNIASHVHRILEGGDSL